MARNLNQTRIRDSWLIALLAVFLALMTKSFIPYANYEPNQILLDEIIEILGYMLIAICALGRLYCTAFLGGHKNKNLIDYGAFSVVRNPLYVFSFVGFLGISLLSMNLAVIVFVPLAFFILYYDLVKREENFLKQEFGETYNDYCNRVPRFVPNFRLYTSPEQVQMNPKTLKNGAFDSMAWFSVMLLYELLEPFLF